MLGITTYQEALRTLGAQLDRERRTEAVPDAAGEAVLPPQEAPLPSNLVVVEESAPRRTYVSLESREQRLSADDWRRLVVRNRALRGLDHTEPGPLSDLLRAVGLALDDVQARLLQLEVRSDQVAVTFTTGGLERRITYQGDDLRTLRLAAAARRIGMPLSRVLVLHEDPEVALSTREPLAAEFAVQDQPMFYAAAVAQSPAAPDVILLVIPRDDQGSSLALEAVYLLRRSPHTSHVPLIGITSPGAGEPASLFAAGLDDLLADNFAPAQLRARVRTWVLRSSQAKPSKVASTALNVHSER